MRCSKHDIEMLLSQYKWEGVQGYICPECSTDAAIRWKEDYGGSVTKEAQKAIDVRENRQG